MHKAIIPAVLALVYVLMGIAVFCIVMRWALCNSIFMWRDSGRGKIGNPLNLLDTDDYCFAVMVGAVWPLSLTGIAAMRAGDWLWDALLSKIVLNSVNKQLEKENRK